MRLRRAAGAIAAVAILGSISIPTAAFAASSPSSWPTAMALPAPAQAVDPAAGFDELVAEVAETMSRADALPVGDNAAMSTQNTATSGLAPVRIILLALVIAASSSAVLPSGLFAAESSPTPEPTLTSAEAACETADDVRLVVEFLQEADVEDDGWLPFLVGTVAGLSSTRELVGLVGDTYRPLVEDLLISFEGLGIAVDELREQETVGALLASMGEAVSEVGYSMDALSVQLRTPCPTDE